MKNILFISMLFCAAINLQSQTVTDEMELQEFAQDFMTAYNQEDQAAIRKMYSEYAVRIDTEGEKMTGANEIVASFEKQFRDNNATLLIKQLKINWSDREHAFIASGTYEIYGKTNVYDIPIHIRGTYANAMIKNNGAWQIAKSWLSPLVKVMVYQQVEDFMKWKSAIEETQSFGLASGQLSTEIGTLQNDPKTAYFISEWDSVESFQNYFDSPESKKAMESAGITEKPKIMVFDK